MEEFQTAGVQGNPAPPKIVSGRPEREHRSVLGIAQNRVGTGCGLDANLVHPAGFEVDFQPRAVLADRQNAVMEHRVPPLGVIRRHHFNLGGIGDLAKVVSPRATIWRDPAFD